MGQQLHFAAQVAVRQRTAVVETVLFDGRPDTLDDVVGRPRPEDIGIANRHVGVMLDGLGQILLVEAPARIKRRGVFGGYGNAHPLEMLVDRFRHFLRKAVGNQAEVNIQRRKIFHEFGEMRPEIGLAASRENKAPQANVRSGGFTISLVMLGELLAVETGLLVIKAIDECYGFVERDTVLLVP